MRANLRIPVFSAILALLVVPPVRAQMTETPQVSFVREFIRELVEQQDVAEANAKDTSVISDSSEMMMASIRCLTRLNIVLRTDVTQLDAVKLGDPFKDVPGMVGATYSQMIKTDDELIDISSKFVGGPRPDVDYGGLAAQTPKLNAVMEAERESLVKVSPLVFLTLVDTNANGPSQPANRLTISRSERDALIAEIHDGFGGKLTDPNPDAYVSAASVILTGLTNKGYLAADDPR